MAELYHSRSGQGEPLLILHGLFGSSRNWQSLARRYAEHFEVFSVDLRNHGQSFHHNDMTYPSMAADVKALTDSLGLTDCLFIGHSMGGKVALQLAIDYPEVIQRMVIADIAPVAYRHDHNETLEALQSIDVDHLQSRADADDGLKPLIPEASFRAFLLQNLVRQGEQFGWRVNLEAVQSHMDDLTGFELPAGKQITTPSLFIYGTGSDYVGEREQQIIRNQFPNAQLFPLQGAGHWLHAEQPEAFYNASLDYLAG